MRLSTKGRYGVRAMVDLAMAGQSAPVTVTDIARRQEISARYLEHMMLRLSAQGLVRPVHGRSGGFVLARPAADITLAQVIEAVEGPFCIVACVSDPGACKRSPLCSARDIWCGLSEAVERYLQGITLEDAAGRQRRKLESGAPSYDI